MSELYVNFKNRDWSGYPPLGLREIPEFRQWFGKLRPYRYWVTAIGGLVLFGLGYLLALDVVRQRTVAGLVLAVAWSGLVYAYFALGDPMRRQRRWIRQEGARMRRYRYPLARIEPQGRAAAIAVAREPRLESGIWWLNVDQATYHRLLPHESRSVPDGAIGWVSFPEALMLRANGRPGWAEPYPGRVGVVHLIREAYDHHVS